MRKEVELNEQTIIRLQRIADKEKRSLKAQMELILNSEALKTETDKQIDLTENIKIVSRKKKDKK